MEWRHEVETAQSQLRRFLVRFKRYNNREGMDVVTTKMLPGKTETSNSKRCCFTPDSPSTWEPIDPVGYLAKGSSSRPASTTYIAKLFDPDNSCISSTLVMLDDEGRAMNGEPIEDNTIVEFNFDLVDKTGLCVRTDKTETTPQQQGGGLQGTANDWVPLWACGVVSSIPLHGRC
jgi:hypothetical protein